MDPSANPIDIITAIQTLSLFFWSFFFVTIFCMLGEMVTNQFNRFHEEMCQLNWYLYPLEMQGLYLIFIAHTQHPAAIYGYGNIVCARGTFKAVTKSLKWFERNTIWLNYFSRHFCRRWIQGSSILWWYGKCRIRATS